MLPSPALIDQLDRAFGNVWSSHEGMQINVSCPFCPRVGKGEDTSGHLGMNFEKAVWHCVRCDSGGNLKKLLDRHGIANLLHSMGLEEMSTITKNLRLARGLTKETSYVPPYLTKDQFPKMRNLTPEDFTPGDPSLFGKSLMDKGLTYEEAERHCLCGSDRGKSNGYVIFPFFETLNEGPVYWQGRDATGNAFLKKLNPSNEECPQGKAHWLYNFEYTDHGQEIYITEGALDAISLQTWLIRNRGAGHTAVSIQGTAISFPAPDVHPLNTQYGKLCAIRPKKVHIVLDADAWKKTEEMANLLSQCGLEAVPVRLYGGDPNELGPRIGQFLSAEGHASSVSALTQMLKGASFR